MTRTAANRFLFSHRPVLLTLVFVVVLIACRCNSSVLYFCEGQHRYNPEEVDPCYHRYDLYCPEGQPDLGWQCEAAFAANEAAGWPNGAPDVTPAPTQQALMSTGVNCDLFRLTAPLDGLPNGGTTFYWDPLLQATGYSVSVWDGGTMLGAWSAPAGATSVGADVSTGAIGGGFVLTVVAQAHTSGETCTSAVTLMREAGGGGAQPPQNNNDDDDDGGSPQNNGGNNNGGGQQPEPSPTPCSSNECIR